MRILQKTIKFFSYKYRQESGVSIVEFALICPLFILTIFGVLQLGMIMIVDNAIEEGLREGARYGITGQGGGTRDSQILSLIQQKAQDYSGGLVKPESLIITINSYSSLENLDSNISAGSGAGSANQAVLYKAQYTWDTVFPIFGTSKNVVLKAQAPVVNENFTS